MYSGYWGIDIEYKEGDIVYLRYIKQYYICKREHRSCNLTTPTDECIYWLKINSKFLKEYVRWEDKEGKGEKRKRMIESDEERDEEKSIKKKKLRKYEEEIEEYNKRDRDINSLRESLMLLNIDTATKAYILDKYDTSKLMSNSELVKTKAWLNTVREIPFGKYKKFMKTNKKEEIKKFLKHIKSTLDKYVYGLDNIKQEILEFVSRKVTNPNGKGEILALCGEAGVGKTRILTSLSEALGLKLHQINCGGLNDVSILTGHSETYVGAKPGKIVEILQRSEYMNPIIYFDELDKISNTRSDEISGVFTHLFDEEQNNKFQDNYLSNINLDMSRAFFVISFNDIKKVNPIVADRLRIIYIDTPSVEQKINISINKVLPEVIKNINPNLKIDITKEMIEYIIIKKCNKEIGIRGIKKMFEKLMNRVNYDILIGEIILKKDEGYEVSRKYIDNVIKECEEDKTYMSMYS